jgi:Glycosyl transferase family 2
VAGRKSRGAVAAESGRGSGRQPDELPGVIRGLLAQSLQPRKIVLYLSLDEFPDRTVPNELSALAGDRFEIRFVEGNLRPYKRLLYALTDFPGATIITVDDDNLHPADCLARLWKASAANPRTVICVRGRCMQIHDGAIAHYMDWRVTLSSKPNFMIFPVGGWGILYPPGSLHPMIGQQEVLKELAPLNDDVWFILLQDVPCYAIGSAKLSARLKYENDYKLWDVDQRGDGYQHTVERVFEHFGL